MVQSHSAIQAFTMLKSVVCSAVKNMQYDSLLERFTSRLADRLAAD